MAMLRRRFASENLNHVGGQQQQQGKTHGQVKLCHCFHLDIFLQNHCSWQQTAKFAVRSKVQARPSIIEVSLGRCPALSFISLPWFDGSWAAVIGPRSRGLCWCSQRVREAGARVVPVHHPVNDSLLPPRSFVKQRAHIFAAARVRPSDQTGVKASSLRC